MSRDRSAALAGVLYVALDVVVGVMAGAAPAPGASRDEIIAYIAAHRPGLAVGLGLFGPATLPPPGWVGWPWGRPVRGGAGTPRPPRVPPAGRLPRGAP